MRAVAEIRLVRQVVRLHWQRQFVERVANAVWRIDIPGKIIVGYLFIFIVFDD